MKKLERLITDFKYNKEKITYLTGGEFEKNFNIVKDYILGLS